MFCWYVVYCVCLVWFGVLCSGVVGVVCVLCVVSRYVVLWVVVLCCDVVVCVLLCRTIWWVAMECVVGR